MSSRIDQENKNGCDVLLYFPLGLARHIDHRLLAEIASTMQQKGQQVFYYEEWPYAVEYDTCKQEVHSAWESLLYPIEKKLTRQDL